MTEERAIELCIKHRDPVGFEFLVGKYRREAYFHALALLGNPEDALDACQECFARAFALIPRLRELPRFYPWFYCMLKNHCLNTIARRKTSERFLEAQQEDPTQGIDPNHPVSLLQDEEDRQRVSRALESLKPEHREILVLKYFLDHTYDAIASILDIPRGTVMSRLYHARLALREKYLAPSGHQPSTEIVS